MVSIQSIKGGDFGDSLSAVVGPAQNANSLGGVCEIGHDCYTLPLLYPHEDFPVFETTGSGRQTGILSVFSAPKILDSDRMI